MIYIVYRKSDCALVGAFYKKELMELLDSGELDYECSFSSHIPK